MIAAALATLAILVSAAAFVMAGNAERRLKKIVDALEAAAQPKQAPDPHRTFGD